MNFERIIYFLPGVLAGLTAHEYCHALAAYRLGDYTAREQGRMSLNPLKHIDPIGFLFIVFAGFGWAKPVQFNPENLRRPRRDKAIIAAAGPLANLVLALLFTALLRGWEALSLLFFSSEGKPAAVLALLFSRPVTGFVTILYYAVTINLGLFIFNLFPIPPLDGSHIAFSGFNLDPETERKIMKIGAPLLFIILIIESRTNITILPIGIFVGKILEFLLPSWV